MNVLDIAAKSATEAFGPWNPGISSRLPEALLPLCTLLRPEHVFTTLQHARDLQDMTGLALEDVVAFRPERLALHELLIRVTADLSVPDGPKVEDLGINFRRMTRTVLNDYIAPHMPSIVAAFEALKAELERLVSAELDTMLGMERGAAKSTPQPAAPAKAGLLSSLLQKLRGNEPHASEVRQATGQGTRGGLPVGRADTDKEGARQAAHRAVQRVAGALFNRHGRLWGGREWVQGLATDMACNEFGSEEVGRLIEPYIEEAVQREGYRRLPPQEQPIVLNTKGASASGKSTLRPAQKALAAEIGADWSEFAVISPDIWRKQLLDYASLGADYKYAGTLAGQELHIVDQKLDRYMARKSESGAMSHLLIDRFRFDSFTPDVEEAGKHLLTRFGHIVYMFFMVTPPEATVERAWNRGLEVGRYKAVDDLLAHNVEAYSGMPRLFFTWARRADMQVHYEFLDNSVPMGERPLTIAFGWNGEMNVLDVRRMIDIERFRRVDVNATAPERLYPERETLAAAENCGFLVQCVRRLPIVNFVERDTGRIYLCTAGGKPEWVDVQLLRKACADADVRVAIEAALPGVLERDSREPQEARYIGAVAEVEHGHTLGRWGERHSTQRQAVGRQASGGTATIRY